MASSSSNDNLMQSGVDDIEGFAEEEANENTKGEDHIDVEGVPPPQKRQRRSSETKPTMSSLPNFPEWQKIRQQYFRMRKVGENLKTNALKQHAEVMRNATRIEDVDDDEDMVVEVKDY
jgi:hypothetical protein